MYCEVQSVCDVWKERGREEVDMLHNLRFPKSGRTRFPRLFPTQTSPRNFSFLLDDHRQLVIAHIVLSLGTSLLQLSVTTGKPNRR